MIEQSRTLAGPRRALGRVILTTTLVCGFAWCLESSTAVAQSASAELRVNDLLEDFNHYVYVANDELALANANAILQMSMDPAEFLAIVEDDPRLEERFEESYRRALTRPNLQDVASDLFQLYEDGRRTRARDIDEIRRNIALLNQGARARSLGKARLLEAGEYAVPELLRVLIENREAAQVLEVKNVLRELNKQAIAPLSAALLKLRPAAQEEVARILGGIGYEAALPFLIELRQTTTVNSVRAAANVAIERLQSDLTGRPLNDIYRELAEDYYNHSQSLTSFPDEAFQVLWTYDPAIGLLPTAIRTEVFHEAMSMRLAERALELNRADRGSLALWVASNYSRERQTPDNYANPVYGADRRDAEYYAVASGSTVLQHVLARAIADRDTALARQAISALSVSAGGAELWKGLGDERPLVSALDYPDRRVRFDAALVLAGVTPDSFYAGADRVVPTLAGSIRDGDTMYAAVIAIDEERQQFLRETLEDAGFTVLPPARSLSEILDSVAVVPGVDIILTDTTEGRSIEAIDEARRTARLSATPILSILPVSVANRLGDRYADDPTTRFVRQGVSASQISRNIDDLIESTVGGTLSGDETADYALQAVAALRDIAIASGDIYMIQDATNQLTTALESAEGELAIGVADVLSRIAEPRAQVAVMDRAINASGSMRIAMLESVTESAKRFGNMLEPRQTRWLTERLRSASGDEATTAAGLVGALNIAGDAVVDLILDR
ncbi:MAG: hypothetical protein RLN60_02835 [Phycisphaerales bacterium]